MFHLSYKGLLTKTFKLVALVYIVLFSVHFFLTLAIGIITQIKFYSSSTFSLYTLSPQLINILGNIIMWVVFYLLLQSNNENSEHFLVAILKVMLVLHIYNFCKSILMNSLNIYLFDYVKLVGLPVVLINIISLVLTSFIIITFLLIVIKSRRQILLYNKLELFKNLALGLIVIRSLISLFDFIQTLSSLRFQDSNDTYVTIMSMITNFFKLVTPIVWLLFIIKFVNNYKYYEVNTNINIKEDLIKYNQSLSNALGKYGLIILLLVGSIVQLGIFACRLIEEIMSISNVKLIYDVLGQPIFDYLIFEVIIVVILTILVLKRNNKLILSPFLGYTFLYVHLFIYCIITILYTLILTNFVDNTNLFNNLEDIYKLIILPLMVVIVYSGFLGLITYRYYRPFDKRIIGNNCHILICLVIFNVLYNLIIDSKFQLTNILSISFHGSNLIYVSLNIIMTICYLGFWIIFPIRLLQELNRQ